MVFVVHFLRSIPLHYQHLMMFGFVLYSVTQIICSYPPPPTKAVNNFPNEFTVLEFGNNKLSAVFAAQAYQQAQTNENIKYPQFPTT